MRRECGMRTIILAALLCVASSVVHAQSLQVVERQCIDDVNRRLHCASCGGAWPNYVRCINQRALHLPTDRVEACMQVIWDHRLEQRTCALCGPDPIDESIACASGQ